MAKSTRPTPSGELPASPDELLTLAQVALLLGVTRTTVRRWILEGRLRALAVGHWIRIRRDHLEAFLRTADTL